MELAHTLPASEVLDHFSVSETKGLSLEELSLAQQKYGPNGKLNILQLYRFNAFDVSLMIFIQIYDSFLHDFISIMHYHLRDFPLIFS